MGRKNKAILHNLTISLSPEFTSATIVELILGKYMLGVIQSIGQTPQGLRSIVLENRALRILVLPETGAKVWQITYKPLDVDLLWNNPSVQPARQILHACYDDAWSGGWDDLFPNDEAATLQGHAFPDHGELWTGDWHVASSQDNDSAGVRLSFKTPVSKILVEKTLHLRAEGAIFEIHYRLTNQGKSAIPFLFKLHPAFAVSPNHRIDFPPMAVLLEPEFLGTLEGAPPAFPWPYAALGGKLLDLRQVPDISSHALHFFYGTGLVNGWCGVTNCAIRLAAALRFDPEVFSSCWLFATHGGWRDLNVAVLEPATGHPFKMERMIAGGRARTLEPGERLETTVLFSAQEGLMSIGGVEENGLILAGD